MMQRAHGDTGELRHLSYREAHDLGLHPDVA